MNLYFKYKYKNVLGKRYWHYQELSLAYLEAGEFLLFLNNIIKSFFNKPIRSKKEYRDIAWSIKNNIKKYKITKSSS